MPAKRGIQWAAGLFEGEGTWTKTKGRSAQASLTSTDRDVVEAFAEIVGFGKVREQKAYGGGHVRSATTEQPHKPQFIWMVSNGLGVRKLIRMFWPYLGDRRRAKAADILKTTEGIGAQGRSKYATACMRGHPFDEANTGYNANGNRYCKTCQREYARARRRKT